MKISFEVDARLVTVTTGCGLAGLFALHVAYPGLYDYWPKTSADLASWMQAFGAVAAIWWSGRLAAKQIQAAREQTTAQIEAASAQAAEQIEAARLQAQVSHMEARKLVSDQRRLDDLLKTEVLQALFSEVYACCGRINVVRADTGISTVEKSVYEHLKEVGYVLRQLPAFELPGQILAALTIRIGKDIEMMCVQGIGLPFVGGGVLYLERVRTLEAQLDQLFVLTQEAIKVCQRQMNELSILSTGARVN